MAWKTGPCAVSIISRGPMMPVDLSKLRIFVQSSRSPDLPRLLFALAYCPCNAKRTFHRKETEMQHFQRLLESPFNWVVHLIETTKTQHRMSVERRKRAELRRRYMNG
jgi:hypothetical protein